MSTHEINWIGDSCLQWKFGNVIDISLSKKVISHYLNIKKHLHCNILDIVPTYNSIAIYFNPIIGNYNDLVDEVNEILKIETSVIECSNHIIEVNYSGDDIERVCDLNEVSHDTLVELHTKPVYSVAMIGFKEHFPYLLGMDEKISAPRLDSPRLRVPKGSVSIGGIQTGIYPEVSPGGWNIIGSCDVDCLQHISIGDTIKFKSI